MNVFILCTGRCGSKTFSKACGEIKNYTIGFESRTQFLGYERLNYTNNHIEIDNRLSWFLGRLDEKYGDDAIYVHLKRKATEVSESYARRYGQGIMKAYRGKGILLGVDKDVDPILIATDYCYTINSNIEMFLKDKTNTIVFNIEQAKKQFPVFCNMITADVDIDNALKHFDKRYNESKRS